MYKEKIIKEDQTATIQESNKSAPISNMFNIFVNDKPIQITIKNKSHIEYLSSIKELCCYELKLYSYIHKSFQQILSTKGSLNKSYCNLVSDDTGLFL